MQTALVAAAAALVWGALAPPAHADLRDAVNRFRMRDCPAPASSALRDSSRLRQAARRMAAGASLRQALSSAGYVASQSSAIHLSGPVGDAQFARLLTGNCGSLTDRRLTEMGAQREGRDIWIVLAAPVAIPSQRDSNAITRQILGVVNEARLTGRRCGGRNYPPAPPLVQNPFLVSAALAHSKDMADFGRFDHSGRDGSTPARRVEHAGYGGFAVVGENIAAGAMTPAEVTQGWLDSPGHCENIMDPRFSETGIAFAVNPSSAELVYWTQDFAAPRGSRSGRVSP